MQTPGPAALAEVAFEPGEDAEAAVAAWRKELSRMLRALGLGRLAKDARARIWPGGAALTFPAPLDRLLDATDVNEWAVESASALLSGRKGRPLGPARERIAAQMQQNARPRLVALEAEAKRRGVPFLWDDDTVTLGMGRRSATFAIDELPSPADVDWGVLGRIPVALVTGTNGKTTTARLLARMAKRAGLLAGNTSTDGVAVDERIIEPGDWTGPGAARLVLRRPDVELAILETARGGLLRRGLAVIGCDAAVITNVSSDHLGEFGILTVADMARTKGVVTSVIRRDGRVVLNAADPSLVALAPEIEAPIVWFSRDPKSAPIARALARGTEAWFVQRGTIVRAEHGERTRLVRVSEMPLAFGGAAAHNVDNALAASAVARGLGFGDAAIAAALREFGASPGDNPGRGRVVRLRGVHLVADFGHNPEGVRHLLALARSLRAPRGRLAWIGGLAGDRTDSDVTAVAREIVRGGVRRVWLRDLAHYLRGREPGEVPAALRRALVGHGLRPDAIDVAEGEPDAAARALRWAKPGDVVVVAPSVEREALEAWLAERGARTFEAQARGRSAKRAGAEARKR